MYWQEKVVDVLHNNWIRDLNHHVGFTVNHFLQYLLWYEISQLQRNT